MIPTPEDVQRQRLIDQHVLAILRASGGWNARARARLAFFAQTRGVEQSVVIASARRLGLARPAAATPAASAALPAVAAGEAGSAPIAGGAPAPGVAPRLAPAPRLRRSHTTSVAIGIGFALLGALLSGAILWIALAKARAPAPAPAAARNDSSGALAPSAPAGRTADAAATRARAAASALDAARAADAASATDAATGRTREIPPAPAIYPSAPALRADPAPPWLRQSLESLAADEAGLDAMAARLASGEGATDADRTRWERAVAAYIAAWPLLEPRRRDEALVHLTRSFSRLGDEAVRAQLREALLRSRDAREATPEAIVRGAGAAGVLAALELHAAGGAPEAFGAAALAWLAPRTADVAASALAGDPARAADLVEAWLWAVDAASLQPALRIERDARVLVAIETLLRRGAPLERPGVAADAAGTLMQALPWAGDAAQRTRVAQALSAWLLDPAITPLALHGLTSILAAQRPGSWWEPWLVSGARANADERARTASRFVAALAAAPSESTTAAPRIKGVAPELVERWSRAAEAVRLRTPSQDPAQRLALAAEQVALVEAYRLMERGLASDAQARIAQVEDPAGLAPDALDRWRDRIERPAVRAASSDGGLVEELRSRRALTDRLAALRMLRTRVAGDLGPVDAGALAREALTSPTPEVRTVAQGVIADAYALGPEVIGALVAEMAAAIAPAEAAKLAAVISGQPVPRGSDERLRSAATLLLLDHLATLSPSERNRVDSVAREFSYSANAVVRALGAPAPGNGASPERAFAAWFQARVEEARPLVPATVLDALLQRAQSRRRLALPGPQAFVAEGSSLVDLEAALLAERVPRRRSEAEACLQRAAAARTQAQDVYGQIEANARALLELAQLAVQPPRSVR